MIRNGFSSKLMKLELHISHLLGLFQSPSHVSTWSYVFVKFANISCFNCAQRHILSTLTFLHLTFPCVMQRKTSSRHFLDLDKGKSKNETLVPPGVATHLTLWRVGQHWERGVTVFLSPATQRTRVETKSRCEPNAARQRPVCGNFVSFNM